MLNAKLRSHLTDFTASKSKEVAQQESMQITKTIQQSLLPSEEIEIPNITTASYFGSTGNFGGTYYDCIPLTEDRIGVFISHVVGKGPYPAILNAMIKSCLHPQVAFDPSVHSVMTIIKQTIRYLADVQMDITGCYMLIDTTAHKLKFANAGYLSILLYCSESREIVELKTTSNSLGFLSDDNHFMCDEREVGWQPHDILILFSDAIMEKQNLNGEAYGIDRLQRTIIAVADLSPHEIQWRILRDLGDHVTNALSGGNTMIAVIKAD